MTDTTSGYTHYKGIDAEHLAIAGTEVTVHLGIDGVTATQPEVDVLAGVTAGTALASKGVVLDANKDVVGIRHLLQDVQALAAAGTGVTNADAGAITKAIVAITAADDTKAVKLPTAIAGMRVTVINTVANKHLHVFPATGGQINALGGDAAYQQAQAITVTYIATSTTQWYTLVGA